MPTGYVWIFTARLVTGKGLPKLAREYAIGFGILFATLTATRIYAADKRWHSLVPGGIAVAIGMYNTPSFTLSRTLGGLLAWYWRRRLGWGDTPLIVLASVGSLTILGFSLRYGTSLADCGLISGVYPRRRFPQHSQPDNAKCRRASSMNLRLPHHPRLCTLSARWLGPLRPHC